MNGVHDMGGGHGHGPVVIEPGEPVFRAGWERRVFGLMQLAIKAGVFNLDEFRHGIERMGQARYLDTGYYEHWLAALERLVGEKGVAAPGYRAAAPEPSESRRHQLFQPGDEVRARNLNPPGHTRLPRYARGKRGVVESVHGPFLLPDTNAHGRSRDWEPVYTVRFAARELWGADAGDRESLSLDLWQSYLEAVE